MSDFLAKALPRRMLLKTLLAVPAFSLFRTMTAPKPIPGGLDDDEIVEVGGWILKRSDLA